MRNLNTKESIYFCMPAIDMIYEDHISKEELFFLIDNFSLLNHRMKNHISEFVFYLVKLENPIFRKEYSESDYKKEKAIIISGLLKCIDSEIHVKSTSEIEKSIMHGAFSYFDEAALLSFTKKELEYYISMSSQANGFNYNIPSILSNKRLNGILKNLIRNRYERLSV